LVFGDVVSSKLGDVPVFVEDVRVFIGDVSILEDDVPK
jgi:hypothetical protein